MIAKLEMLNRTFNHHQQQYIHLNRHLYIYPTTTIHPPIILTATNASTTISAGLLSQVSILQHQQIQNQPHIKDDIIKEVRNNIAKKRQQFHFQSNVIEIIHRGGKIKDHHYFTNRQILYSILAPGLTKKVLQKPILNPYKHTKI